MDAVIGMEEFTTVGGGEAFDRKFSRNKEKNKYFENLLFHYMLRYDGQCQLYIGRRTYKLNQNIFLSSDPGLSSLSAKLTSSLTILLTNSV